MGVNRTAGVRGNSPPLRLSSRRALLSRSASQMACKTHHTVSAFLSENSSGLPNDSAAATGLDIGHAES